jgi:drug/metabolite transporter (DMT)-like permease
LLVIGDPRLKGDAAGHYPGSTAAGVLNGFLGSLCQALGVVFSKKGMEAVEPLEASFIRLATAAGVVFLLALLLGKLGDWRRLLLAPGVPAPLAGAATCGTYLGIWLSLTAFKHTKLAVATTLTALSPVFVLPLAWVFLGSRITPRALAGACLAVGGVAMLF